MAGAYNYVVCKHSHGCGLRRRVRGSWRTSRNTALAVLLVLLLQDAGLGSFRTSAKRVSAKGIPALYSVSRPRTLHTDPRRFGSPVGRGHFTHHCVPGSWIGTAPISILGFSGCILNASSAVSKTHRSSPQSCLEAGVCGARCGAMGLYTSEEARTVRSLIVSCWRGLGNEYAG